MKEFNIYQIRFLCYFVGMNLLVKRMLEDGSIFELFEQHAMNRLCNPRLDELARVHFSNHR